MQDDGVDAANDEDCNQYQNPHGRGEAAEYHQWFRNLKKEAEDREALNRKHFLREVADAHQISFPNYHTELVLPNRRGELQIPRFIVLDEIAIYEKCRSTLQRLFQSTRESAIVQLNVCGVMIHCSLIYMFSLLTR